MIETEDAGGGVGWGDLRPHTVRGEQATGPKPDLGSHAARAMRVEILEKLQHPRYCNIMVPL